MTGAWPSAHLRSAGKDTESPALPSNWTTHSEPVPTYDGSTVNDVIDAVLTVIRLSDVTVTVSPSPAGVYSVAVFILLNSLLIWFSGIHPESFVSCDVFVGMAVLTAFIELSVCSFV